MELDRVRAIAIELLKSTHLFWTGWRVEFDNAKSYYGSYDHRRRVIILSRYLTLNSSEAVVREAILHQIAHAVAGYQTTNHGKEWQTIAKNIGTSGRASIANIRLCKIKLPRLAPADSPVARQFFKVFGDAAYVLKIHQLREMTAFRFADYDTQQPLAEVAGFLELKLWREIGEKRLMRLFFQTKEQNFFCLDVWENSFTKECRPADKGFDLKKAEVGKWYELLTAKDERGFIRLQSMKKLI